MRGEASVRSSVDRFSERKATSAQVCVIRGRRRVSVTEFGLRKNGEANRPRLKDGSLSQPSLLDALVVSQVSTLPLFFSSSSSSTVSSTDRYFAHSRYLSRLVSSLPAEHELETISSVRLISPPSFDITVLHNLPTSYPLATRHYLYPFVSLLTRNVLPAQLPTLPFTPSYRVRCHRRRMEGPFRLPVGTRSIATARLD